MEKFSLYDLLSVLFPGIIFMSMLNEVRLIFGWFPGYNLTDQWEVLIILSVLFGALIYIVSFWLTERCKWVYKFFGIYRNLTFIYNQLDLHKIQGATLNRRAMEWYDEGVFVSAEDFKRLIDDEKEHLTDKQGEFYDRLYYELDYKGKLTVPKAFQSFYLFFRNVFLAAVISLKLGVLLYLVNLIPFLSFAQTDNFAALSLLILLTVVLIFSLLIARWYRQRMVYKMYWFFYTHINAQE